MKLLFAIDVAAYGVMFNHLHVVLHIGIETVVRWSDRDAIQQWHKLIKGDGLTHKCQWSAD